MGSYLANNHAANTLFGDAFHDRSAKPQRLMMLTVRSSVEVVSVNAHTASPWQRAAKTRIKWLCAAPGVKIAPSESTDGLDRWQYGANGSAAPQPQTARSRP